MKALIVFIYSMFLCDYCIAQINNTISIDFEVDGKRISYKNATVKFIYAHDTLNANIDDSTVIIPALVFKKNVSFSGLKSSCVYAPENLCRYKLKAWFKSSFGICGCICKLIFYILWHIFICQLSALVFQ